MFPKPIGSNRGGGGTLTGSLGITYEKFDGNTQTASTLAVVNSDISDVVEYEYWNGSAWVATTIGAIGGMGYALGFRIRARLVNAYFGTSSAYVESIASNQEDTGGLGTIAMVVPIVTSKPAYINPASISVEYSVDASMTNARNLYNAEVFINASYVGVDSLQHQVNTTTAWPPTVGPHTVVIATPDAADFTTIADVRWFSQVTQRAYWVDSGPGTANTASVTDSHP